MSIREKEAAKKRSIVTGVANYIGRSFWRRSNLDMAKPVSFKVSRRLLSLSADNIKNANSGISEREQAEGNGVVEFVDTLLSQGIKMYQLIRTYEALRRQNIVLLICMAGTVILGARYVAAFEGAKHIMVLNTGIIVCTAILFALKYSYNANLMWRIEKRQLTGRLWVREVSRNGVPLLPKRLPAGYLAALKSDYINAKKMS